MYMASTIKKGYSCRLRSLSFQDVTTGSKALHRLDTVDLEKVVPHNSSVMRFTFRVDTPFYDHLHER